MRTPWQHGADDGRSNGRGPRHRANGVAPGHMNAEPVELDEHRFEPIDLAAVHADEELISALAGGRAVASSGFGPQYSDDRLTEMLQAWRAEVEAEPVPSLLTVDQAASTIRRGRVAVKRSRFLVPIAGAAAILAVAVSGVVIGAHDARPGDPLWAVSKVLYQERAESVENAVAAQVRLKKVRQAMVEGRTEEAKAELAAAGLNLNGVRDEEGKDELSAQAEFLNAKLEDAPPGVPIDLTDPSAGSSAGTSPSSSLSKVPSSSVLKPPPPASSVPPVSPPPHSSGGDGSG